MGAARWRVASILLQGTLQFGIAVVLARLLPPQDFGLATLAAVIIGLATVLLELSLGAAIVQLHPLTDRHLRASFTLAFLLGGGLAAAVFVVGPLLGSLLRSERLPMLLRVQSPLFLLAAVGVTARALLQRRLAFREIGLVDLASYACGYGITALLLAWMGFGVWSLVAGAMVQSLLANTIVLGLVRHPMKPLLAGSETSELLHFGGGGALNGALAQVALHGDNLIIGRLLGTHALGLYARAFSLMILPVGYAGNTLFGVLFPALSQLRADRERFSSAYLMSVALISLAVAPVMAGMVVAAPHLVTGLYGQAWAGAAAPLQVFCGVGLFRVLALPAGAVNLASGQVYAELRRQLVYTLWVLVGSLVGTRWGVAGVAIGVATAILFKYVAMVALSLRLSGVGWGQFLAAQAPGVSLAGLVAVVALGSRLALEGAGAGHLTIFLGITASCAVALPIGLYFIPARLRPSKLFGRVAASLAPLPSVIRAPVRWVLRSGAA